METTQPDDLFRRWRKWAIIALVMIWAALGVGRWVAYKDFPPPIVAGTSLLVYVFVSLIYVVMAVWFVRAVLTMAQIERREGKWVFTIPGRPGQTADRVRWLSLHLGLFLLLGLSWAAQW